MREDEFQPGRLWPQVGDGMQDACEHIALNRWLRAALQPPNQKAPKQPQHPAAAPSRPPMGAPAAPLSRSFFRISISASSLALVSHWAASLPLALAAAPAPASPPCCCWDAPCWACCASTGSALASAAAENVSCLPSVWPQWGQL